MTNPRLILQNQLLHALDETKKEMARLQKALAHNAVLLGEGIEPLELDEDEIKNRHAWEAALKKIGLEKYEPDMSDYLGSENVEGSRPRLPDNAPINIRPRLSPPLSPQLHQVAAVHPDDLIILDKINETGRMHSDTPAKNIVQKASADEQAPTDLQTIPQILAYTVPAGRSENTNPNNSSPPAAVLPLGRLEPLMDQLNAGILEWDIQKNTVNLSGRWRQILPKGPHDDKQSILNAIFHKLESADAVSLQYHFNKLFTSSKNQLSIKIRVRRTDRQWDWAWLNVMCRRNSTGKPVLLRALIMIADVQADGGQALSVALNGQMSLADASPDIVARFDSNATLLYISPSISRYVNVTQDDAVGKPFPHMGEATGLINEGLKKVLDLHLPFQTELSLRSPLVGRFQANCRFWPEFGPDGEVLTVILHIHDHTFAKRLADNYKTLFTGMADGFAVFEHLPQREIIPSHRAHEFLVFAVNPAFIRIFNITENQASGRSLLQLLGPNAEVFTEQCLLKVLPDDKKVSVSFKIAGQERFLDVTAYSPEPGRIACIVKDITDQHRIVQEGKLNEARFAALYRLSHMDAAPEEEVIQFSLDQAVQLTGSGLGFLHLAKEHSENRQETYWSKEVLDWYSDSKPPAIPPELLHEDTSQKDFILRRAEIINVAKAGLQKATGGRLDIYRFMVAPVIEDNKIVCIAGVANKKKTYQQSDLRQLELFINGMWFQLRRRWTVQTLRKAKEAAEAANRAKSEFLANVSHELRTPLNGILGMLQLLQQSALSPTQLEYVNTASYSGRSLLRVISDILDFSRIEAGRLELAPRVFDFTATVRSTLGLFVHQAEQKNIRFTLHLEKNIPKFLYGDDARIRQIIFNLVGNAFKFTESGQISVVCSVLPYCQNGKCCIYIAIQDSGIGIPDEKLGDIFNAFTQLDSSNTRKYPGSGLGLGIVRRLVQLMRGNLTVESELGAGTCIHCSIPLDIAPEPPQEQHPAPVQHRPAPLSILVAEDDPVNQLAIRSLLQKQGHTVFCVGNGAEAIQALLLQPFDCLITDIQMPLMDGTELVNRIRSNNYAGFEPSADLLNRLNKPTKGFVTFPIPTDIPVIALTAHAMNGDREHFLNIGMNYYLSKPVIAEELNAVLGKVHCILHQQDHP